MNLEQLNWLHSVLLAIFVEHQLAAFEQAWRLRLPDLPFPIRVEGPRFFYRTWKGDWVEYEEYSDALQKLRAGRVKNIC